MFHPLSVYVGLRYVRARSYTFFVSFITWASLVGVCVGVAALIVILPAQSRPQSRAPGHSEREAGRASRRGPLGLSAWLRTRSCRHSPCAAPRCCRCCCAVSTHGDRKSTRLTSSHSQSSYAVFCSLKKKHTVPPPP